MGKNIFLLPSTLEKYFMGENREILLEWLSGMTDDESKDFLQNLAVVVEEAEQKKMDVVSVINRYKNLKMSNSQKNYPERLIEKESKLFFLGLAILSAILFLIFSSVLLLVSMERRTRIVD